MTHARRPSAPTPRFSRSTSFLQNRVSSKKAWNLASGLNRISSRRAPSEYRVSPMVGCDFHSADRIVLGWQDPQAPGLPRGITILKDYLQRIRCEFLLAQTPAHQLPPGRDRPGEWREPPLVIPVGKDRARQVYGFVSTFRTARRIPSCSASARGHPILHYCYGRSPRVVRLRKAVRLESPLVPGETLSSRVNLSVRPLLS